MQMGGLGGIEQRGGLLWSLLPPAFLLAAMSGIFTYLNSEHNELEGRHNGLTERVAEMDRDNREKHAEFLAFMGPRAAVPESLAQMKEQIRQLTAEVERIRMETERLEEVQRRIERGMWPSD